MPEFVAVYSNFVCLRSRPSERATPPLAKPAGLAAVRGIDLWPAAARDRGPGISELEGYTRYDVYGNPVLKKAVTATCYCLNRHTAYVHSRVSYKEGPKGPRSLLRPNEGVDIELSLIGGSPAVDFIIPVEQIAKDFEPPYTRKKKSNLALSLPRGPSNHKVHPPRAVDAHASR